MDPFEAWLAKNPNKLPTDDEVGALEEVESHGDHSAVSNKGAKGSMQVMPLTAKLAGVTDMNDPAQMRQAGAKYFAFLLDKYGGGRDKAVAAYNAGPTRVDRGSPLPEEATNHVRKFNDAYRRRTSRPDDVAHLAQRHPITLGMVKDDLAAPELKAPSVKSDKLAKVTEWLDLFSRPAEGAGVLEKTVNALNPVTNVAGMSAHALQNWNEGGPWTTRTPGIGVQVPNSAAVDAAALAGPTVLRGVASIPKALEHAVQETFNPVRGGVGARIWAAPKPAEVKAFDADKNAGMTPRELFAKYGMYEDPNDGKVFKEVNDQFSMATGTPVTKTYQPMEDILKHDELYSRHPELRGAQIRLLDTSKPENKNTEGQHLGNMKFEVSPEVAADPERLRSVLLHEAQHGLDSARGADPGYDPRALPRETKEERQRLTNEANAHQRSAETAKSVTQVLEALKADPSLKVSEAITQVSTKLPTEARRALTNRITQLRRQNLTIDDAIAAAKEDAELSHAAWEAKGAERDAAPRITSYEANLRYDRNVGESRASAVQERINLSDDERRARFPDQDMRYPMADQLTAEQGYTLGDVPQPRGGGTVAARKRRAYNAPNKESD